MTKTIDLLPEGLEDRLPASAARITSAMRACLDVLDRHGYDRVRPPVLEFERSLASRMAHETGGVQTQKMFRFVDPASLRTLALRSDITPQIGRIAATSMKDAPRPLRLAYCGDTVLIKASQLDPARERLQLGGELIGADSVAAASEIVTLAIEALKSAGLTGISVDFTMPDLLDTLVSQGSQGTQGGGQESPMGPDTLEAIRRELDTKDAGGLKDAGGEAYLPLLYAAGPFADAVAKLREFDAGGSLSTRLDGLEEIAARVDAMDAGSARITLDPTERYGFEYQSWFGFTLYAEGLRGAAGRGGTYRIDGSDEAATGFTLYVDRVAEVSNLKPFPRWTIFCATGHDPKEAAGARQQGHRTIAQLSPDDDPATFGCTHIMRGSDVTKL